jgi:hypothetical protein
MSPSSVACDSGARALRFLINVRQEAIHIGRDRIELFDEREVTSIE